MKKGAEQLLLSIPPQKQLWDQRHLTRGKDGPEGTSCAFLPNQSATEFGLLFTNLTNILEIGCANGRDARYLALLGHKVTAIDFSPVAIAQLLKLAGKQGVSDRVTALQHDYSNGTLPNLEPRSYGACYARSALHLDDSTMSKLGTAISGLLVPNGLIFIEGKGLCDPKIQRSKDLDHGLSLDDDGHLRRH